MRIYDIISKKKRARPLTKEEIHFFVKEYTEGNIPDYQASALLMAICINGMTDEETLALTDAIAKSGDSVDLSQFGELTVDKHSTGGVGDKTTLIVAPIVSSLGLKVAKMSGRGLGHTGGTVDKLESLAGYNTSLSPEKFFSQVREIGIAVTGQSGNLAPADKKIYALRDVTATVDSIPLITSSIMGKKLPSGSKTIVLDVKYGSGAFMKTKEDAEILAEKMVSIGNSSGRNTAALITNMDVPLGFAIGNSLEVIEAIETLSRRGPSDLAEISIELSAAIASLALKIPLDEARRRATEAISSGAALKKFKEWISYQGADCRVVEDYSLFKAPLYSYDVVAASDGFIYSMNAEGIGEAATILGAGREKKDDVIDFSAGILLKKKTGDKVSNGEVIATLYTDKAESAGAAERVFLSSLVISKTAPECEPLIFKTVF